MKPSDKAAPFLYFDNLTAWPGHGTRPPHAPMVAGTHTPIFVHRPKRQPLRSARQYPSRAMLIVLLLVGVVVLAVCWNARPGSGQGIDLHAAVGSPKVNYTSAQNAPTPAPKLHDAPVAAPSAFEEPKTLVPVMLYGPGSLACSCFHDPLQGDSPMLRNWNVLKMTTVMAVTLAVAPAWSAEPGDTELEKLSKLVKELKKACDDQKDTSDKQKDALATIGDKLDKLINNTTKGFDGINADLAKLKTDVKGLTEDNADTKLTVQSALGKIKTLEEQVALLKGEMNRLQKRDPALYPGVGVDDIKVRLDKIETALAKLAEGRTSFSPPTGAGKIQLANLYPEEILFVINNKPYRVPPNTTMDLPNQPAGPFTYEVISGTYGLRARNSPLLEAGKSYTITVR
jgi:archaellum component FlaC